MRKTFVLLATALLILTGCAKMGQPDGGWYDETPPHVIGSTPDDKSTGVNTRNINISELNSGIYFVTVKANGFENTMKFIVK